MTTERQMMLVQEADREVKLMARRMALLYYHFANAIVEEVGEDKGRQIIKKTIESYGAECGLEVRAGVEKMHLPLTAANFSRVPDLPSLGWKTELISYPDGRQNPRVHFCPLAKVWQEKGAEKLGRLYCYVDQAKFSSYNPCLECVHEKNVLDGDPYCELAIAEKPEE